MSQAATQRIKWGLAAVLLLRIDGWPGFCRWPYNHEMASLAEGMNLTVWLHNASSNFLADPSPVMCAEGIRLTTMFETYNHCPRTTGIRYVTIQRFTRTPGALALTEVAVYRSCEQRPLMPVVFIVPSMGAQRPCLTRASCRMSFPCFLSVPCYAANACGQPIPSPSKCGLHGSCPTAPPLRRCVHTPGLYHIAHSLARP